MSYVDSGKGQAFLKLLKYYHNHKVFGIEHIPAKGRILVVVNHSLATYDIGLLIHEILTKTGRKARPLGDRLLFKIPYLKKVVTSVGAVEGNMRSATNLLLNEELVTVAPGGMRESLRPSSERYQLCWQKRKGFARLAIETQTPIVLAMCPKADEIYDVYSSKLTAWSYKKFKIPVVFARGLGLSIIPKPVALNHYLSPCIYPPKIKSKIHPLHVYHFHKKLLKLSDQLMAHGVSS